jgi:hypothetical protein
MKIDYKINEIYDNIYHCIIDDRYDLAMTFCRIQEFYESSFSEIRGKVFSMIEFQRMYSKKYGEGAFTYTNDWAGFNVPSTVIWNLYYGSKIKDFNEYDLVFQKIIDEISFKNTEKYYLIGTMSEDTETINHEVAHAFYCLNPKYRSKSNKILSKLDKGTYQQLEKVLVSIGYTKKVIKDEINAYLSTGTHPPEDLKLNKKQTCNLKEVILDLKNNFLNYEQSNRK